MTAAYDAHLRQRLVQSNVPEQLHDGLVHYIGERRHVGQFLTAVLSNDLKDACARADNVCQVHLHSLIFFLYNYAPGDCWGSRDKVTAWLYATSKPREVFE